MPTEIKTDPKLIQVPASPNADATLWEEEEAWEETAENRKLAQEVFDRATFMGDLRTASRRITDQINGDPTEALKLRKARADARAGKRSPRTSEERSS